MWGRFKSAICDQSVFYQYVRTAALNQQQTQHVSVFTTELFAHYLHICIKWRHFDQTASTGEIQKFQAILCNEQLLLATDLLLCRITSCLQYARNNERLTVASDQTEPLVSHQLDTSELVELLQQSAVEHLTSFRQLEAALFGSTAEIAHVTTDFEALYAYKCGDYQRCLQLSAQNVRTLIAGPAVSAVQTAPEFLWLMDDDIVSLIGLTLIADPSCRDYGPHVLISQLSLSLYLMTQCQLKLHHPVTSLALTLDYIEAARLKVICRELSLDQLTLKLTEHKILQYLSVVA